MTPVVPREATPTPAGAATPAMAAPTAAAPTPIAQTGSSAGLTAALKHTFPNRSGPRTIKEAVVETTNTLQRAVAKLRNKDGEDKGRNDSDVIERKRLKVEREQASALRGMGAQLGAVALAMLMKGRPIDELPKLSGMLRDPTGMMLG